MIDASAFVHPSAKLGPNVSVGRNAFIDAEVEIGEGSIIKPYAMITGRAKLGKFNRVFPYACLGEEPQDYSYQAEPTQLIIGDYNTFREGVTIHRGTVKGGGITRIGHHNYVMAYAHIGHDCCIGDHNTIVNYVGLSGHTTIAHHVLLSAYSGIHQFARVGAYAMVAHAAMVSLDVPPFVLVAGGDGPYTVGLNVRGLQRNGFTSDEILHLKRLYKIFYRSDLALDVALHRIEVEVLVHCDRALMFLEFVRGSTRGVLRK